MYSYCSPVKSYGPVLRSSSLSRSYVSTNPYLSASRYNVIESVSPMRHEWTEYQPVQQRYIDYVPEVKVDYRPVERVYRDYVAVRHVTDYEPVRRLEKRTEYVKVDNYDEYVDYVPRSYSYVSRTPGFSRSYSLRGSQYRVYS